MQMNGSEMQWHVHGGRNGIIELLRFVCALIVVLFHTGFLVKGRSLADGPLFFTAGSCAVEFFFVLSGFLMARSIAKKHASGATGGSIGSETFDFVFKKMCRLWPHVLLSCSMILCVNVFVGRMTVQAAMLKAWTCISELLFVHMSGFTYGMINGHLWYLSAMLLAMWTLYPLARTKSNLFNFVIAPLMALLLIGWLVQANGGVGRPVVRSGFFLNGLVRAFAEVCAGCFCFEVSERLSANRRLQKRQGLAILLWSVCVAVALFWMWRNFGGSVFHLLLLFCVIITLSFSLPVFEMKQGGRLYHVCKWLGALSLPIYIHQNWAIVIGGIIYPSIETFGIYTKGVLVVLAILLPFSIVAELTFRGLRMNCLGYGKEKGVG